MASAIRELPDALVLGVGGTLGIAWLRGVLSGLEEAAGVDLRECEYFVGTSAGSVVAAGLAAGQRPRDAARGVAAPDAAAVAGGGATKIGSDAAGSVGVAARLVGGATAWGAAVSAPLAPAALALAAPGGAVARAAALATLPKPRRRLSELGGALHALGARFDGRLRVVAVDRARGRRVVFGAPGAPPSTVTDAVLASCSIPWVFAPVVIDGREYVDGGVWSPTNLDVVPGGRGSQVLCLMPTGAFRAAGPLGALRALTRAAVVAERQVLRARGAQVRVVAPDAASVRAMGLNLMDASASGRVYTAGVAQGRALGGAG